MISVDLWIFLPCLVVLASILFTFWPAIVGESGPGAGMGVIMCGFIAFCFDIAFLILYLIAWIIFR